MISFVFAQLIVLFILLIINYVRRVKKLCKLQLTTMTDIYSTLKTGDILFTRFDYFDAYLIQYLIRNVIYSHVSDLYTHVGMVVKIENTLYIYSAYQDVKYDWITNTYKTGSVLILLRDYIMTYNGNIVLFRLLNSVGTTGLYDVITENKNKIFDNNMYRIINTILDITKNKKHTDKIICTQAVGDALIGVGLMSPLTYTPNLSVGDITSFVKTSEKYGAPVMVVNPYVEAKCV